MNNPTRRDNEFKSFQHERRFDEASDRFEPAWNERQVDDCLLGRTDSVMRQLFGVFVTADKVSDNEKRRIVTLKLLRSGTSFVLFPLGLLDSGNNL
jgi:hypothetical protein